MAQGLRSDLLWYHLRRGCLQALVLGPGDHVTATSSGGAGAPFKFLLIAGRPINEPIVQHGPFVMNTKARPGREGVG